MSVNGEEEKWGGIRAPYRIIAELDAIALELEESVANATTLKVQEKIRIEGGLSDRFGCAKWKVIERLLHDYRLKQARKKRYQARRRKRR